MSKYKVGDTIYIIENNRFVRECMVNKVMGNRYQLIIDGKSALNLNESRVFGTKEEAESRLPQKEISKPKHKTPYDYM